MTETHQTWSWTQILWGKKTQISSGFSSQRSQRVAYLGYCCELIHWGQTMHICVGNLTNIGSDNGLSPGRRQAIIWTNDGILSIGPLRTNISEILIAILTFSFEKMRLKVSSAKRRPFCLGLNVLKWPWWCMTVVLKVAIGICIVRNLNVPKQTYTRINLYFVCNATYSKFDYGYLVCVWVL